MLYRFSARTNLLPPGCRRRRQRRAYDSDGPHRGRHQRPGGDAGEREEETGRGYSLESIWVSATSEIDPDPGSGTPPLLRNAWEAAQDGHPEHYPQEASLRLWVAKNDGNGRKRGRRSGIFSCRLFRSAVSQLTDRCSLVTLRS